MKSTSLQNWRTTTTFCLQVYSYTYWFENYPTISVQIYTLLHVHCDFQYFPCIVAALPCNWLFIRQELYRQHKPTDEANLFPVDALDAVCHESKANRCSNNTVRCWYWQFSHSGSHQPHTRSCKTKQTRSFKIVLLTSFTKSTTKILLLKFRGRFLPSHLITAGSKNSVNANF